MDLLLQPQPGVAWQFVSGLIAIAALINLTYCCTHRRQPRMYGSLNWGCRYLANLSVFFGGVCQAFTPLAFPIVLLTGLCCALFVSIAPRGREVIA